MVRIFATLVAVLAAASPTYADARKDCFDLSGEIAIRACTEALRLSPNEVRLYMARGYEYNHLPDYDRGLADYTKASQLEPNNADAYHGRGYAYAGKRQYDLAIAEDTKAIRLKPNNHVAYSDRGSAHYNKGEYDRAIEDANQALKIKPDYAPAIRLRTDAITKRNN